MTSWGSSSAGEITYFAYSSGNHELTLTCPWPWEAHMRPRLLKQVMVQGKTKKEVMAKKSLLEDLRGLLVLMEENLKEGQVHEESYTTIPCTLVLKEEEVAWLESLEGPARLVAYLLLAPFGDEGAFLEGHEYTLETVEEQLAFYLPAYTSLLKGEMPLVSFPWRTPLVGSLTAREMGVLYSFSTKHYPLLRDRDLLEERARAFSAFTALDPHRVDLLVAQGGAAFLPWEAPEVQAWSRTTPTATSAFYNLFSLLPLDPLQGMDEACLPELLRKWEAIPLEASILPGGYLGGSDEAALTFLQEVYRTPLLLSYMDHMLARQDPGANTDCRENFLYGGLTPFHPLLMATVEEELLKAYPAQEVLTLYFALQERCKRRSPLPWPFWESLMALVGETGGQPLAWLLTLLEEDYFQ